MIANMREIMLKKQAYKEGAEQKAIETAKNLISKEIALEVIAECTGLSLEEVQNLQNELVTK